MDRSHLPPDPGPVGLAASVGAATARCRTGRGRSVSPGHRTEQPFSDLLATWLEDDTPKTVGRLEELFGQKGVAVTIFFMMLVPALPLPTGGITMVFEAITVLLGVQMVIGARTIWLPARWRNRELGEIATEKAIPFIVGRIRWFERFARGRGAHLFERPWFFRLLGLVVIALAIASALAPPFSGLDTVPAMGAVVVALAIVLGDVLVLGIGVAIGAGGIALILAIGAAIIRLLGGPFSGLATGP